MLGGRGKGGIRVSPSSILGKRHKKVGNPCYRPISLLSVVAKTLEKCLLPYITANITQTPTQHGYKAQHSTVTALHTLNNTVAKGFNQMAPPARTITVALDMSKAFDTVNTHTLIGKLLQTSTPGTILKFVANYIKGRKAYTSFRNHKSIQRQVKTGVPQGGVLSHTLFNIHTADIPTPTAPVQVMMYADDCSARNLRSNDMMLVRPCHPVPRLKTYGEKSFQFAGPKEWNNLPLLIHESSSIYIFKSRLKTYLFNCAFN